jgi:hypothetical protein
LLAVAGIERFLPVWSFESVVDGWLYERLEMVVDQLGCKATYADSVTDF